MEDNELNKKKGHKKKIMTAKRIDILFASHMYQLVGGAELALYDEVVYLKKSGLHVHVIIGAEDSFSDALRKADIPYTHIDLAWWARASHDSSPYTYSHPDLHYNSLVKIVELINTLQPHLCATNTIVFPWMAYAAAMTNTPHIWQIHEMGHIHHLQYELGKKQTFTTIDMLSNKVFYNSKTTAEYYTPYISKDKLGGIIYPIGPVNSTNTAPTDSPFNPNSFKLVAVGQVKAQKRQLDAVKVVRNLIKHGINAEIAIIGLLEDESYVKEVTSYIKKNKLSKQVHLLGFRDNPSAYVKLADVALFSAEKEAFGRVTVEAMSLGKPVVGAASGGTTEIIDDKKNGFLFDPGNIDQATDILKELYRDPALRTRIGGAARKQAIARFSQHTVYKPLLEYLSKVKHTPEGAPLNLTPLSSLIADHARLINDSEQKLSKIRALETELSLIHSSRSWKLASRARNIHRAAKRLYKNKPNE